MRKNVVATLALLAVATAPLYAQGGGMQMDPTAKITGTGKLPDGWMMRFDPVRARPGQPAPAPHVMTEINLVTMGQGFHVSSGPAAIYYRTADVAKGNFTASVSLSQRKSMQHEAYGLFIGGANLQDSTQSYLYYVIRPLDGGILINYRGSDARPKSIVAWTPDAAVNKDDPTDGKATNVLAIKVEGDAVSFMANGKVVKTLPKSELAGMATDGQVGLRINHNLDLHIANFTITK